MYAIFNTATHKLIEGRFTTFAAACDAIYRTGWIHAVYISHQSGNYPVGGALLNVEPVSEGEYPEPNTTGRSAF